MTNTGGLSPLGADMPVSVPNHIAIIMDGNGRWAERQGLPRSMGHKQGVEAVKTVVSTALELGINYLTLYAFSSENWGRPADEIRDLMGLLRLYFRREISRFESEGIRLRVIGQRFRLADDINVMIDDAEKRTAHNNRMTVVIALSYGSRDEITDACRALATAVVEGRESLENITPDRFEQALGTHDIPDPDLLIRTSGEQRLSNFLLWQLAYSEFLFTETLWPDFGAEEFRAAVDQFAGRDRRYGRRT